MKLSVKSAGLCTCGAFILIACSGVFRHSDSFNILVTSITGSIVAGIIGFSIGDILGKPKGGPRRRDRKPKQAVRFEPKKSAIKSESAAAMPEADLGVASELLPAAEDPDTGL